MESDPQAQRSQTQLAAEFDNQIRHYFRLGRWNYRTAYGLRLGTLLASIVAGGLGLAHIDPRIVGMVAFLPAAFTLLTTRMKFQDRSNWHYRKAEALQGFRSELLYRIVPLTSAGIADLSRRETEKSLAMTLEWERLFGSDTDLVKDSVGLPDRPAMTNAP